MHFKHLEQQQQKQIYLKLQIMKLRLQPIIKIFKQLHFNKLNRKVKFKHLKIKILRKVAKIGNK